MNQTYATIVKLKDIDNTDADTTDADTTTEPIIIDPKLLKETLKLEYLDENDLKLYDFINDLKRYWNERGFINTLKHQNVVKILKETINVSEFAVDEDDYDDDDDESDFYE
jgi:hypothetical protein